MSNLFHVSNLFRRNDRWVPSYGINTDEITDGFHTFGELYEHRRALVAVLCRILCEGELRSETWRSKAHHPDDTEPMFEGRFIVGIELPTGTIRYHFGLKHWDDFAAVPEVKHAPEWDGAGPPETVKRLLELAREPMS